MVSIVTLVSLCLCLAATAASAVYAILRRTTFRVGGLAALLAAESAWVVACLAEFVSSGPGLKLLWNDLRIVVMLLIPQAALAFALGFTAGNVRRRRAFWPTMLITPAVFCALLFTDSFHGLFRGAYSPAGGRFLLLADPRTAVYLFVSLSAGGLLLAAVFAFYAHFSFLRVRPRLWILAVLAGLLIQSFATVISIVGPGLGLAGDAFTLTFAVGAALAGFACTGAEVPSVLGVSGGVESIRDAVIITDPDGRVVDANPAALALFGVRYREAVGRPLADLSADVAGIVARHGGEEAFRTELAPDERRPAAGYELRLSTMHGPRGEVTGRLVLIQDVTERKRNERELRRARDECEERIMERTDELSRLNKELAAEVNERTTAESALRESEEKLRSFIAESTEGLALVDEKGVVVEWNRSLERITGMDRAGVIGKPFWDVHLTLMPSEAGAGEGLVTWLDVLRLGAAQPAKNPVDVTIVTLSGERRVCALSVFFIDSTAGRRIGAIVLDVTEQRTAHQALLESGLRYRALYESSGDAIYLLRKGVVVDCNRRALTMFGHAEREEVVGRVVERGLPPEDGGLDPRFAAYLVRAEAGDPQAFEWASARTDGTVLNLEITLTRVPLEGEEIVQEIVRDITDRKKTEADLARYRGGLEELVRKRTMELEEAHAELVRRERLAALGQVAATVSHEIKNPLGTVKNALFTLAEVLEKSGGERAQRALELAERNIRRCDRIIADLLDFTRKRALVMSETDLDPWISSVLDEQQIPEGCVLERELSSGARVRIDAEQMRRALVNVITNAVQAMGEEGARGKRLRIASRVAEGRIEIEAADEGAGMGLEVMARMWEPLYSTKPYGVGLGMPVVRAVMEEHGGGVDVRSAEGKGTTVVLWLPRQAG